MLTNSLKALSRAGLLFIFLCITAGISVYGQGNQASTEVDSLTNAVNTSSDSIQAVLASVNQQLSSSLQHNDSLVNGVDSLVARTQIVSDSLKQLADSLSSVTQLQLPASNALSTYQQKAKGYSQIADTLLPGSELSGLVPSLPASSINISNNSLADNNKLAELTSKPDISVSLPDLSSSKDIEISKIPLQTEKVGQATNGLSDYQLPEIRVDSATGKNIDNWIDRKASEHELANELTAKPNAKEALFGIPMEELSPDQLPSISQESLQKAQSFIAEQHTKVAEHRERIARHQKHYKRINSLKEEKKLPYLKRHSLREIEWKHRLLYGLSWQSGRGGTGQVEAFRIDLGPELAYQLTDHIQLGLATQARLSIGKSLPTNSWVSHSYDPIWGGQLYGSYQIKNGFFGRVSWQQLYRGRPLAAFQESTETYESRVANNLRLGLGKSYRLGRWLKGYTLLEYSLALNTIPKEHEAYRKPLQIRMGLMLAPKSERKKK
jgi:hypothetical protein